MRQNRSLRMVKFLVLFLESSQITTVGSNSNLCRPLVVVVVAVVVACCLFLVAFVVVLIACIPA